MENIQQLALSKPPEAAVRLESFNVVGPDATLTLTMTPWWFSSSEKCSLKVELAGLVEFNFLCSGERLPVETNLFELTSSDPLLLNYGPTATIFGNAPLPDPPRFLFDFYRLVVSKLKIPRDPVSYLNAKDGLSQSGFPQSGISRWLEFVYSRSYCLLSAPELVVEGTKELLDAQLAEYMILPDQQKEASQELQLLKLGSNFAIFHSCKIVKPVALSGNTDNQQM